MSLNPSIKYMPKYSGNEYELRVGRVKMEDKGEYTVRAENSYGNKSEVASMNVQGKHRVLCYIFCHPKSADPEPIFTKVCVWGVGGWGLESPTP